MNSIQKALQSILSEGDSISRRLETDDALSIVQAISLGAIFEKMCSNGQKNHSVLLGRYQSELLEGVSDDVSETIAKAQTP